MGHSPSWFRMDVAVFHHPKIKQAKRRGGPEALLLWQQALAYAVQYRTDGWVPPDLPKDCGYNGRQTNALVHAGLWVPVEVDDCGGWLIHDFRDYQITAEEWEAKVDQRRAAARKRWAS